MTENPQAFDPKQEYSIVEHRLPHWSQAGTMCFITWRTWDSMPAKVAERWSAERDEWLCLHGINVIGWKPTVEAWRSGRRAEFQRFATDRWERQLDALYGECVLRRADLSQVVVDALHHFDADRYLLSDYVIMPNHVHVLAAFLGTDAMVRQCESWKRYSATRINRMVHRTGRFWQQDSFDHLVRSTEQFEHLRRYIAENPIRAKLPPGEYRHFRRGGEP